MRLLIDMNLAPRWVQWLRDAGVDAIHWTDVGAPTATDAAIFSYAQQNGLVVFTHDLDFGALLAHTRAGGPSVIQIRTQDTSPEAVGQFSRGRGPCLPVARALPTCRSACHTLQAAGSVQG